MAPRKKSENPEHDGVIASLVVELRDSADPDLVAENGRRTCQREIDVAFTSNLLEHLHDKAECDAVFAEVLRLLRPAGDSSSCRTSSTAIGPSGIFTITTCRCRTSRWKKA
jgi:hypothetical protein